MLIQLNLVNNDKEEVGQYVMTAKPWSIILPTLLPFSAKICDRGLLVLTGIKAKEQNQLC